MNQKYGGDTGIDADVNDDYMREVEIIYIDGYWLDTKETFENYKCVMGIWIQNEDDNDIFYYFESEEMLKRFQISEGRTDTEFVITKVDRNNYFKTREL